MAYDPEFDKTGVGGGAGTSPGRASTPSPSTRGTPSPSTPYPQFGSGNPNRTAPYGFDGIPNTDDDVPFPAGTVFDGDVAGPESWVVNNTNALNDLRDTLTPSANPKYATSSPDDYRYARQQFADQFGVPQADLTTRINALALSWYKSHHNRWPTSSEMLTWDAAQKSISEFVAKWWRLPRFFNLLNDDGSSTGIYNDPVFGLTERGQINSVVGVGGDLRQLEASFISWSQAEFDEIAASLQPATSGSPGRGRRGSGSRGGAGRPPIVFDKAQLSEQASKRWKGLLLEDPGDGVLSKLVSDYATQANAFWQREAGRLDFDTFVVDRIRATERHTLLYQKKQDFQTEEEYMGGYRQTVARFGLNDRNTLQQVESGAKSGAGLAGFGERVSRSRPARLAANGSFSRQVAGQMAQMGRLG